MDQIQILKRLLDIVRAAETLVKPNERETATQQAIHRNNLIDAIERLDGLHDVGIEGLSVADRAAWDLRGILAYGCGYLQVKI